MGPIDKAMNLSRMNRETLADMVVSLGVNMETLREELAETRQERDRYRRALAELVRDNR